MALGKRVKQRRKELGMTQNELAKKLNMTQAAISALEDRDSRSSSKITNFSEAEYPTEMREGLRGLYDENFTLPSN